MEMPLYARLQNVCCSAHCLFVRRVGLACCRPQHRSPGNVRESARPFIWCHLKQQREGWSWSLGDLRWNALDGRARERAEKPRLREKLSFLPERQRIVASSWLTSHSTGPRAAVAELDR